MKRFVIVILGYLGFLVAALFTVFLIPNISYAGLFGPSNYDECILDSMKGVTNDKAAISIRNACWNKFPSKKVESKLSASEISLIDISDLTLIEKSYQSPGTVTLSGNVYNGNKDKELNFLTIEVSYKNGTKRLYRAFVIHGVSPLTTKGFEVTVDYSSKIENCTVVGGE